MKTVIDFVDLPAEIGKRFRASLVKKGRACLENGAKS